MRCSDFHALADSYLGDELLIETNHDVLKHLEACAACRGELAARRELRSTLRTAFANSAELQPHPDFAMRLRARLRSAAAGERAAHGTAWGKWMAIAASVLLVVTLGLLASRQSHSNSSTELAGENEKQIDTNAAVAKHQITPHDEERVAVEVAMTELVGVAVGDHRNCAVKFRLAEPPIPLEEAGRKFDPAYLQLASAVMDDRNRFDGEVEIVMAHSCVFEGKRFGHLVLRRGDHLVSLLVTDLDDGEVAAMTHGRSFTDANRVIFGEAIEGYQVSRFATARHGVFIISDLTEAENLEIARSLARSVYTHIARTESSTA